MAVWAYRLVQCKDRKIDEAIQRFYNEVIYAFWDKERRLVENGYQTAAFDFSPLPAKDFVIHCHWTKKELLGYVSSWSSVQQYKAANGHSPLPLLEEMLPVSWNDGEQQHFQFPLFLKIGRITK